MEKVDYLLVNGTIITMDESFSLYQKGAVAVRGDSIVAVGNSAELLSQYEATELIDCTDQLIIPGLVNAHTHVPMTLLRGLNDDLRLDVWLGYLMPVEREFVSADFVRLGTRLACAEMLRSGITTFADMYYYETDIAAETAKIGMRALLGQTIIVFPTPDAHTYEEGIDLCRKFIEQWQGHSLIQPAVSPHAWYTATPQLLQACAELALAYDVPIHTHVSETVLEVENCRSQHDMPVVPWISKWGILDAKLLAAHCVHVDRGEMVKLKKCGAGIAHCPTSNLKLASGIANVQEMLEIGLNVGVGTDGAASNNDLDMFEEMRLAALLAKVKQSDPTHLPARAALQLATIGGAKAIHLGHLTGSLEVGKRADITIVATGGLHSWPHFDNQPDAVYSRLVYSTKSSDVTDVMCNGQWLLRQKQLLTIDEVKTQSDAAKVAKRIDAFVRERESSPYNKLIVLEGTRREESFEVQIKVAIEQGREKELAAILDSDRFEVVRHRHYRQYDHYFVFNGGDPDADRLRYREEESLDDLGRITQVRTRLTLLGKKNREIYPNAVMLSRSRLLADAKNSLRFYQEYFQPTKEIEVNKDRLRWRIHYKGREFAVNLDTILKPALDTAYLEIKARTWSRSDAEQKAGLIGELLELLGVAMYSAETKEYAELVGI